MCKYRSRGAQKSENPYLSHLSLIFSVLIVLFSLNPDPANSSRFNQIPKLTQTSLVRSISYELQGARSAFSTHTLTNDRAQETRVDLTDLPFATIDPANAYELDDAIYVKAVNDNEKQVKIAIADPVSIILSQYPETLSTALKQVFTRYEENPVRPLFPSEVTQATSLLPDRDCPAVVVDFTINNAGSLLADPEIYLAKMRSRVKFSYEQVNEYYAREYISDSDGLIPLCTIRDVGKILRQDRIGDSSEFISSEDVVAEFMIKANMLVAEYMHMNGLVAPYRVQEDPGERAYYALKPLGHASMNLTYYTHFTSPLRRFPDCMVHAALFYPDFWRHLSQQGQTSGSLEGIVINSLAIVNSVENEIKDEKLAQKKLKRNRGRPMLDLSLSTDDILKG